MKALGTAAALASLWAALTGCSHGSPPPVPATPPQLSSATAPAPAPELERAASATPTGVLVVAGSIVHRCPMLAAMKAQPPSEDDESAWLSILQRLADCATKGDLRHERLSIAGGPRAMAMVTYVLGKMGLEQSRLELTDPGEDVCDLDDEGCNYFAVRVDIVHREQARAK